MRIFVAGSSGQVARALVEAGSRRHELKAFGRPEFDLTRGDLVVQAVEAFAPDAIINAGAYTAVDAAETNEDEATSISVGAAVLAEAAKRLQIPFVHISTDYVFDGSSEQPYREDNAPAPIGAYGRSKLAGERAVQSAYADAVIVRTSWVFHHEGKNFLRTMLGLAETRPVVQVVADQFGTPTYAVDLAAALLRIVEAFRFDPAHSGIFHLSGAGRSSWFEFAEEIFAGARTRGMKASDVVPIPTSAYPTPAKRPMYSALDCGRAEASYGIVMPDWRDATGRCLDRIKSERIGS
jgi:dTDP-4-dehydrorhamnose reductase